MTLAMPGRLLLGRWALLPALLTAELLWLTLRFDTDVLLDHPQWWARWLGESGQAPGLAIVVAAAVILGRGARLGPGLVQNLRRIEPARGWWAYLLGHLAAYAAFATLTGLLITRESRSLNLGGGWFLAWLLVGMATLALWGAVLVRPSLWGALARTGAPSLLIGALIGALAWAVGGLLQSLWRPLGHWTLWTVFALLRPVCADVVCLPAQSIIGTERFQILIGPPCSGYEGIGLVWVFLGAYLWLFRRTLQFPRALILLPVGTVVIWLTNSLRIAAMVLIGTHGSEAVAMGGFHSQAGLLAFNAVALGLVVASRRFWILGAPRSAAPADEPGSGSAPAAAEVGPNAAAVYLAPFSALVGVMMITAAVSPGDGFDRLYPLRVLATLAVLGQYRRHYHDLRGFWSGSKRGYVPALIVGVIVFVLWTALEPRPTPADSAPVAAGLARLGAGGAAAWLIFRAVGSVVVVPLAEELAFRGFLTRRLIAADFTTVPPGAFTWPSFLLSSLLFGLLHGRWLAGTLAGLCYAGALYRRRSLADAVLAHATTNALITVSVLVTRSWSLWS